MYSATGGSASSGRGRSLRRTATSLAATLLLVWAAGAVPVRAQNTGRLNGVYGGRAESDLLWSTPVKTSSRPGFLLGAFVDVLTPIPRLRVRAEGGFARRGGFVSTDTRGNPLDGEVSGDYLHFGVEAKLSVSLGPLHAFGAAGPGLDYLVRSREDPVLAQVFADKRGTILTAGAAAGAGVTVGRRWVVEAEARLTRGLTEAYAGAGLSVRNRSLEWVLRLSRVAGDSG